MRKSGIHRGPASPRCRNPGLQPCRNPGLQRCRKALQAGAPEGALEKWKCRDGAGEISRGLWKSLGCYGNLEGNVVGNESAMSDAGK